MASKQPEKPKIWLLPEHDADIMDKRIMSETASTSYDYSCFILETNRNIHSPMSEDPDECEIEFEALRTGGALDLFSLEAFGLLSQYAAGHQQPPLIDSAARTSLRLKPAPVSTPQMVPSYDKSYNPAFGDFRQYLS
ncbi:hypothetical protein AC1031_005911 [Aphanomyces cochlioides]|nr:hypothetical protein AC1031_005911 [Aphanomyces cochlioides]